MKRIVFAVLPEKGHINPYIGPAQALQNRGHDVAFVSPGNIRHQLEQAGLCFHDNLLAAAEPSQPMKGQELVKLIQDPKRMHQWIESLLLADVNEDVERFELYFRAQLPDVVVIDPLYYAAVIASKRQRIPWVSMSNSLNPVLEDGIQSPLLTSLEVLRDPRAELFKSFGAECEFRGCDALSPSLNIAFCTEEFIGRKVADVKMVGPSLPLSKRGDETFWPGLEFSTPVVYASFGSQIYYWPEIFQRLIAVAKRMRIELILSVGELAEQWNEDLPPNVRVFSYAPQLEVLRRAQVFITHGGANSVMEALSFGVPTLISPMCNDQFHQAHFIKKSGTGVELNLQTASVDDIQKNLTCLLEDSQMKQRLQKVSRSYQKNGAEEAAQWVSTLL